MKEARAQLNTALLTNATLADKLSKAEAVNAALKEQVRPPTPCIFTSLR